ncbi:sulfotransferase domain-containing protein [Pelagibacteraceae bacterium]|nr:sulfotransferase domain-containing protein [Pelagibacteraceae bacterium]
MQNQIFWLSSYPKSGNTLLRYMLIALFFTDDGKFSFDKSKFISQFDQTVIIKNNKHIFGDDFKKIGNIEIFYKYMDQLQTKKSLGFENDFIFLKTHAGLFKVNNNSFTKIENTRGFIYLVRDPRDVCISNAKHNGITFDQSINIMLNKNTLIDWVKRKEDEKIFDKYTTPKSLMSSWKSHVISWTSINWNIPYLILKYEDLVYDKKNTLQKITLFFEENYNFKFHGIDKKIANIIETTQFNNFKKHEENNGFNEASSFNSFFSVGQKNQWKEKLTESQIQKIEGSFSNIMKNFNYKLSVEL